MNDRIKHTFLQLMFWVLPLACVTYLLADSLHSHGIVGRTRKNGEGCTCHSPFPSDSVKVWISGPTVLLKGQEGRYTILMTGGPAIAGGYNVAAGSGALSPEDSTSRLLPSIDGMELTHASPKQFTNDTARWEFRYAPGSAKGSDTLYSVANSTNGNRSPDGDLYNFGPPFIVDIHNDSTTGVGLTTVDSRAFQLRQNFPNPFNPSTRIGFTLRTAGQVRLTVFDITGREVARLLERTLPPGFHEVSWDASGYAGSVYFYRLQTGGNSEIRKMLLIR